LFKCPLGSVLIHRNLFLSAKWTLNVTCFACGYHTVSVHSVFVVSLSVPDEGHWAYLMKFIERTWWRSLSVPDEGYSRNASCTLSLISTFYSLHSVSTESYRVYHVSCTLDQYTNIVWTNDIEHRSGNPKWT
jgi:hypothetical protein